MSNRVVHTVQRTCTCGGVLYIGDMDEPNPIIAHTLPPCDAYEALDTVDDAATFLAFVNANEKRTMQ